MLRYAGAKIRTRIRMQASNVTNGQVAQLVEQRTENPRVGSSILPLATIFKPQPLSVGVFSYLLPPDPANTRGTLSRFADFDSLACYPPLAT
jgi:hypothetical protein